jgi:hypothetical protein
MDRQDDTESLDDSLAQGIAAVIAAGEEFDDEPLDMADLYLEELNRLWAEPTPLMLG